MFFDAAAGGVYVIGGGRRANDQAGNPSRRRGGALDVFTAGERASLPKALNSTAAALPNRAVRGRAAYGLCRRADTGWQGSGDPRIRLP